MMLTEMNADFLPGRLELSAGRPSDYAELERFHYLRVRPATWAGVWVARYMKADSAGARVIGIGVLSYPSAVQRTRHDVFQMHSLRFGEKMRFANAHLRTISRVIVHPQFRSIGLARTLVRTMIQECPTPFIEASARMGWAHPMFERAGMTRVEPIDLSRPVYYWCERRARSP